jgi:hypothetical protein
VLCGFKTSGDASDLHIPLPSIVPFSHSETSSFMAVYIPSSQAGLVFAHGTTGAKLTVAPPPPIHKNCKKRSEALQYCDGNEFIELTVGASRVLMSKAATNNIFSNKHKA